MTSADGPWFLSEEPLFRLGWDDGDPAFGYIVDGILLPDGRSVVADMNPPNVFVISPEGHVLRRFGREGEGPGELFSIRRIIDMGGDTLLIEDNRAVRLTAFHEGDAVWQIDLSLRQSRATPMDRLEVLGSTEDGDILFSAQPSNAPTLSDTWRAAPVVIMRRDGEGLDTVSSYDALPPESLDWGSFTPIGSVDVAGEWIVTARGDRPEVRWLDQSGILRRIARYDSEPPTLTEAFRNDYRAFLEERVPLEQVDQIDQAITSLEGPLAYFSEVRGDAEGNAWLRSVETLYRDPESYLVISSDGRWIGVVDVPERLQILAIGDDRVLVAERSDLDVHAVAVYKLTKQEGGRSRNMRKE